MAADDHIDDVESVDEPPEVRLERLSAMAEAAAADVSRRAEVVEIRQECLALAHLICRDDSLQLALAASDLASAYLHAGQASAASWHASRAEILLRSHPPAYLFHALSTLVQALAAERRHTDALGAFPRALEASRRAHGPRHISVCRMLRALSRMLASIRPPDYARAEALLDEERAIRLASGQGSEGDEREAGMDDGPSGGTSSYSAVSEKRCRSAGTLHRPDGDDIYTLDHERAVIMLARADFLEGRAGRHDAQREAGRQRPQAQLTNHGGGKGVRGGSAARMSRAGREVSTHTAKEGGSEPTGAEAAALAIVKRREAAELLRGLTSSQGHDGSVSASGGTVAMGDSIDAGGADQDMRAPVQHSATSLVEAQLAVRLSSAYAGLEQWEEAEASCLNAIAYFEAFHGASDRRVLSLWLEVAGIRMRRGKHEAAARDYAHAYEVGKLVHGVASAALVPTLERLVKVFVLMRRWADARDAMEELHTLSVQVHGAEHRETRRIEDVRASLVKYAPPQELLRGSTGHT